MEERPMKLNRRGFLTGVSALGSAFAFADAGFRARSAFAASPARVTLWEIATGGDRTLVQQTVQRFDQSHPDINVEVEFFENDPYKTKLRVAMGAGQPPDVFIGWGGGILQSYVQNGKVVALPESVNTARFIESVMKAVTFNDKVYGVPCRGMQPVLFYYNKPIFQKYGISPPKTWGELVSTVRTLRAKGVVPISLAGLGNWPGLMYEEYLVNRIGGNAPFQAVLDRKPDAWSNPAFLQANQKIVELVDLHAFPSDFDALNYNTGQSTQLLYSDKAAMQLMGSWDYAAILSDAPDFIAKGELGWFPFPAVEGGVGDPKNVAGNPCNFYSISARSPSVSQAETFLADGVLNEFEIDGYLKLGEVPPVKGIRSKLTGMEHPDWLLAIYDLASQAPDFSLSWDQALPPREAQTMLTNLGLLFLKQLTPEQFAAQMNQSMHA
jgi:raffinose/stachyose/melibiose transport system substrate-binding protein